DCRHSRPGPGGIAWPRPKRAAGHAAGASFGAWPDFRATPAIGTEAPPTGSPENRAFDGRGRGARIRRRHYTGAMNPTRTLRHWLSHTLRFGFRLLPLPQSTRDRWRQAFLDRHGALVPEGPHGQVSDHPARRHAPRLCTGQPAIGFRPHREGSL